MKLGDLLIGLENRTTLPPGWLEREVRDIAHDSRKVKPGSLFVAASSSGFPSAARPNKRLSPGREVHQSRLAGHVGTERVGKAETVSLPA